MEPRAINAKKDAYLAVGIFIASKEVPYRKLVVADINSLADTDVKWETVSERLIEEWRDSGNGSRHKTSSADVTVQCNLCLSLGHRAEN